MHQNLFNIMIQIKIYVQPVWIKDDFQTKVCPTRVKQHARLMLFLMVVA